MYDIGKLPSDQEIDRFLDEAALYDDAGYRRLRHVLFQQLLRPFRALARAVRR